jgi:arylformamidase
MSRAFIRDISVPLRPHGFPVWPGDATPVFRLSSSHERGDGVDVTQLALSAHTGTHLDAPRHFVAGAGLVTGLDLRALMGPAHVVHYAGSGLLDAAFFAAQHLPDPCPRVLLRCDKNAGRLEQSVFFEDYAAITPEAADWLVARGCRLIGTDYLSIGSFHAGNREVHVTLLGAGVIIVEGLDLRGVEPGEHTLICLPPPLPCDGAPCRAVLLPPGALPDPLLSDQTAAATDDADPTPAGPAAPTSF